MKHEPIDRSYEFRLRLPPEVRDFVKAEARRNGASINSEIVRALVERRDHLARERRRLDRGARA
jgi:hypothetical protein